MIVFEVITSCSQSLLQAVLRELCGAVEKIRMSRVLGKGLTLLYQLSGPQRPRILSMAVHQTTKIHETYSNHLIRYLHFNSIRKTQKNYSILSVELLFTDLIRRIFTSKYYLSSRLLFSTFK